MGRRKMERRRGEQGAEQGVEGGRTRGVGRSSTTNILFPLSDLNLNSWLTYTCTSKTGVSNRIPMPQNIAHTPVVWMLWQSKIKDSIRALMH